MKKIVSVIRLRGLIGSSSRLFSTSGTSRAASGAPLSSVAPLISASDALALHGPTTKFVDGSWFLPHMNRDPEKEFIENGRVKGAVRFSLEDVCSKDSSLPHMMPTEEQFVDWARSSGLSNEDHVIIYGTKDCFSTPRVWWTFKVFNHVKVSIMNGGLEAWKNEGGQIEKGSYVVVSDEHRDSDYQSNGINKALVVNSEEVMKVVMDGTAQIADARPEPRFTGAQEEPRPGLARGHIPGSLNVPFADLLHPEDKTQFRKPIEIRARLRTAGVIPGSKVITTCGSGVTACAISFGMVLLGSEPEEVPVYDGSWAEWGLPAKTDLPKFRTDEGVLDN
jgi:thiosulfate/3-mercaptopyruvate sulfurtransferase